jgi:hypothetical protein
MLDTADHKQEYSVEPRLVALNYARAPALAERGEREGRSRSRGEPEPGGAGPAGRRRPRRVPCGCGRKRVLTTPARLARLGVPLARDLGAPRYRAPTLPQQEDVTTLYNNGQGLDFYALCRVVRNVHPLAIFLFLRNAVHPRGWWMHPCSECRRPFATPPPSQRLCSLGHGVRRALESA